MKFFKKPIFIILIAGLAFAGIAVAQDYYVKNSEKQSKTLNIGDKAPDITLKDPDGNVIKLSDLQGKVVLLDFWASWCRPCRMENPKLVKTYKKFKDADFRNAEGFTVYSVSLDRKKDSWTKAIKADNLSWDNHVSDLKFWNSKAAKKYNINAIPATFLIDAEGTILAKNLRGNSLNNALTKMTK